MTRRGVVRRATALTGAPALAALAFAAPAQAVPDCTTPLPAVRPVLTGQGSLESVIVDGRGRLFFTDSTAGALKRVDAPGAAPAVVADGIQAPGGLAFDADGRHLFVGQGDSVAGGIQGNLQPVASLLRIDVETGARTTFATGLRMANGLARAQDGTLFASTDFGTSVDRISSAGVLQQNWATVVSGNGMAIDRAQANLYIAQTFQPAAITRIPLAAPDRAAPIFTATGADITAGLDGMTIDGADRLVVAANLPGEVWRITTDGFACALGRGLASTSAVAYGQGKAGFSQGRLFAVGFDGIVAEVPGGQVPAAGAGAPIISRPATPRVTLLPARARVRDGRVRVVLKVRRNDRFIATQVLVRGRVVRTGRRVTIRVPRRARRIVVRFTVDGRSYVRSVRLVRTR